jgi:hypothetical protein
VRGTIDADDAIGFDPRPLLIALDRAGARAVVIGQVAGILHGSAELTGDLDLLWSGRPDEASAMARAFADVGAQLADDDGQPLAVDAASLARPKVVFRTSQASGDCCTPALPWGALDVAAFAARADVAGVDGATIHFVSLEDLVAMRRAVGRPKDIRRAAELEALARDRRILVGQADTVPGMDDAVREALATDLTVDITTTGRRSGQPRRLEIWLLCIDGRYFITGTPGRRSWLANLQEDPRLVVHLKQRVHADLPARAAVVDDEATRRSVLGHEAAAWYRSQVALDDLVARAPMVELQFDAVQP